MNLSMSTTTLFLLSAVLFGSALSIGCSSIMAVPSNLLNGLQRTDVAAATAAQQAATAAAAPVDEELTQGMKELNEIRDLLHKMIRDGELTQNQAELQFLRERSRIASQEEQMSQQRDLAARQRLQQALSGLRSCQTNGLGYTNCF